MNGPPAVYDDLAIEPDVEFESRLRRQLDGELRSVRVQQFTLPTDIEVDIPLSPIPEQQPDQERGRSRRSMIAIAAAIVASIAVGVVVDRLAVDDDSTPPATVPTPTLPSTTITTPMTQAPPTTSRSDQPDLNAAAESLLSDTDHGINGVRHGSGDGGVRLLSEVADVTPSCAPFASTVFELPAAMRGRTFYNDDITFSTVMAQYVAVMSSVKQATDVLDGIRDPRFLADCAPDYITTMAGNMAISAWFPFFAGEEVEPPAIEVHADDVWVGEVTESSMDPGGSPTSTIAIAAVRVGRIVTIVDLMLEDGDGHELATIDDFERVVQKAADRAADAQAVS